MTKISKADMHYYFDAQAQDRFDRGVLARRSGQVLAIREKLMSLPADEFELAVKTIDKMVTVPSQPAAKARQEHGPDTQRRALELYESVSESGGLGGSDRVDPI